MAEQEKLDPALKREFLEAQIEEMKVHKWLESEKAGHDLGQACLLDWIKDHAADFRREFIQKKETEAFARCSEERR